MVRYWIHWPAARSGDFVVILPRKSIARSTRVQYQDFDVSIELIAGRSYPIAVLHSPAGEAAEVADFPFDAVAVKLHLTQLENALLKSGNRRRHVPTESEQAQRSWLPLRRQCFLRCWFLNTAGWRVSNALEFSPPSSRVSGSTKISANWPFGTTARGTRNATVVPGLRRHGDRPTH